jgi:protease I
MSRLQNLRVAAIAVDGFEESELIEPMEALRREGAQIDVLSKQAGEIQGYRHHDRSRKVTVDRALDAVRVTDYDALLLPGGALNADEARMLPKVREFIYEMDRAGQPIAAICHAPWELISAGIVRGRNLTSWHTIEDDLRNAGAIWEDRECVVDHNIVTSRGPHDLPVFARELINLFARVPAVVRR